jgi:hypothetical protein
MKTFYHCSLVLVVCLSLIGMCLGGGVLCHSHHTDHDNTGITGDSHSHPTLSSIPLSGYHVTDDHESHHADSSEKCCQSSPKNTSVYARFSALANKTKTSRSSLVVVFSVRTAFNCFQHSGKNFITEIFNAINPALESLRTVILLT